MKRLKICNNSFKLGSEFPWVKKFFSDIPWLGQIYPIRIPWVASGGGVPGNSHWLVLNNNENVCGLVWFYAYKCHICLPISAYRLWEWLIILTLFAQLIYVNVLHWIVRLYYYGFSVNEGICLILVIQIFYPSTLSVLYNKDVYPTSSIVWSTTFPFNILKSH